MTLPRRVLLVTRSAGKLRELKHLFQDVGIHVDDLASAQVPELPEEGGVESFSTFEENALAKGRYFRERTGLPVVADDSGLEVLALGGAPGVRSKRWSERDDLAGVALDDANNAKLLERLENVSDRRARYVCAAAFVDDAGEIVERGETAGCIVTEGRGREGFGYDPHFYSTELGRTFGESSLAEKARVSHRARAIAALLERVRAAR
jgi:XTP/dITP diphosphohydrolase